MWTQTGPGDSWALLARLLPQPLPRSTPVVVIVLVVSLLSCVQLFATPMDCSLPGSSIHGISQARIPEWVAISSPRDPPDPGIKPKSPALADGFLTTESPGKRTSLLFRVCCYLAPRTSIFWSSFRCNTSKESTRCEHCPEDWERHRGQDLCKSPSQQLPDHWCNDLPLSSSLAFTREQI